MKSDAPSTVPCSYFKTSGNKEWWWGKKASIGV